MRRKILYEQAVFTRRCVSEPEAVKEELLGRRAQLPRPRLRHRAALHAALPPLAAAPRLRPRRRHVQGASPRARPRSSRTRSSASPRRASCSKSGTLLDADIVLTATGFDLSVLGDIAFTIDGAAARLLRHRHLPRDDVHRRAQHGLGLRLLPRELDPARRPRRRLRVPPAQPHGGQRRAARGARAAPARISDMPLLPWIDPDNFNPGYMMRGMHLLPRAGRQAGMGAHPGLLGREGRHPGHRPRRRRVRLRLMG